MASHRAAPVAGPALRSRPAPRGSAATESTTTEKMPWNHTSIVQAPPHRAPPNPTLAYSSARTGVAYSSHNVDQMMRLSVAENVQPELQQQRGNVVWLRAQNIKLARANRQLVLHVARLEAAAQYGVGDGAIEAMRSQLLVEYEREHELERRKHRRELEELQRALAIMTQRVDDLQGRPSRPSRGHRMDAHGFVVEAGGHGPVIIDTPMTRKLVAGKVLTTEEMASLKAQALEALTDTDEVVAARALAEQANAILRRDTSGLDELRLENTTLRKQLAEFHHRAAEQGASGGSGGGGHGTSVLAEENRSLKALLLATEEQCARLSAASYYARGAGIQQERDVRLASL